MTLSRAAQSAKLLKAAYVVLDIKMWSLFSWGKDNPRTGDCFWNQCAASLAHISMLLEARPIK